MDSAGEKIGERLERRAAVSPVVAREFGEDAAGRGGRSAPKPVERFEFLDGLRGFAAVYVVLFHTCSMRLGADVANSDVLKGIQHLFGFGHYAVVLFIVLSGFCLGLPVANSPEVALRGGVSTFLSRRARRILPPYWTALALGVGLFVIQHYVTRQPINLREVIPNIVAHVLVLHNLNPAWITSFNGPLWSIAIEFQIYVIYALALIPVWKRFGVWALFAASVLTCFSLEYVVPEAKISGLGSPWLLACFALGVVGAAVVGGRKPVNVSAAHALIVSGVLATIALSVVYGLRFDMGAIKLPYPWIGDLIGGGVASLMLVILSLAAQQGRRNMAHRLLENRVAMWLGTVSFSLYLTHQLVMEAFDFTMRQLGVPPLNAYFAGYALLPVYLLVAALFWWAVERHFINPPAKTVPP